MIRGEEMFLTHIKILLKLTTFKGKPERLEKLVNYINKQSVFTKPT